MPPRHVYWTIILEGKPTAFRAHTSDELLPTLKQLQARHPDAVMRWFARGRLWQSPEEERAAAQAQRQPRERRAPGWRPGGEHRDPRDRFKVPRDEKRRRFAANQRRERNETAPGEPGRGRPDEGARPGGNRRPRDDQRSGGGFGKTDRPQHARPTWPRSDKAPGWRPRPPGAPGRGDRASGPGGVRGDRKPGGTTGRRPPGGGGNRRGPGGGGDRRGPGGGARGGGGRGSGGRGGGRGGQGGPR